MPKSKIFLPDVNIWLALASERHANHRTAAQWFEQIGPNESVFCRVTQMGLLRLLTTARVMGNDVVTQATAWRVYRQLENDDRTGFLAEPEGLEAAWERLTRQAQPAAYQWNDAYLQAFCGTVSTLGCDL